MSSPSPLHCIFVSSSLHPSPSLHLSFVLVPVVPLVALGGDGWMLNWIGNGNGMGMGMGMGMEWNGNSEWNGMDGWMDKLRTPDGA